MDRYEYFGLERMPIEEIIRIEEEGRGKNFIENILESFVAGDAKEAYRKSDALLKRLEASVAEGGEIVEVDINSPNIISMTSLIRSFSEAALFAMKGRCNKAESIVARIEDIVKSYEVSGYYTGIGAQIDTIRDSICKKRKNLKGTVKQLDELDKELALAKLMRYDTSNIESQIEKLEEEQNNYFKRAVSVNKAVKRYYQDNKEAQIKVSLEEGGFGHIIRIYDDISGKGYETGVRLDGRISRVHKEMEHTVLPKHLNRDEIKYRLEREVEKLKKEGYKNIQSVDVNN